MTHGYDSWGVSEFMINYQGGFVRRGLIGEALFLLAQHFPIDVEWTIKIICLVCLLLVLTFFVKSFLKRGYSIYILPLCFFFGGIIISRYWIRKDCFMLCFFILMLWIFEKQKLSIIVKVLFINILAIFILLSHEVFIFFSFPILFVLLFHTFNKNKRTYTSLALSFVSLLPGVLVFLLVSSMHGNEDTALSIWDSWRTVLHLNSSDISMWNSIGAIGWEARWAIRHHLIVIFLNDEYQNINPALFSLVIFPMVYYISTNVLYAFRKRPEIFTEKHRTVLSSIILFQWICLLPVFAFLITDTCRIYFYLMASSFAIFLLVPLSTLENLFPKILVKTTEAINNWLDWFLPASKTTLAILMMGIGISLWSFSLESAYQSTMFYWILELPSHIIKLFYL
jgi:hypothetical protein